MKVLHVTTHFNIGGISNYILTLSKALKEKGIDVVVASSGGDLELELVKSGISHRVIDIATKFELGPKVFKGAFAISRIARNEKIDIIHAHSRVSQVASAIASRLTGVPYVTTCHGYFKKRFRRIVDTWGVRVIAISDAVKTHLINDLGVERARIALIYSGVDIKKFSKRYSDSEITGIKKQLGLKEGPVVGTIGRLSPVKGQVYLVRALKDAIRADRRIQGLIVGSGEEGPALKKLAETLGIGDSVKFFESCPDTNRFLSIMDVFVFPSVKEGLGIALLEALAAGRAVVASRVGGIEDIIKNGLNGILVDVGDVRGISDSVLTLLANEERRKSMGDRGRQLVVERFTLASMADKIAELYKEVSR
ncbi:MAG: glycosyltransferase family 4 protein [Candidatus Omnitrophica bacterium]|nr:glycosyltransferase family 4 protein [Candidatus Omnitrophota bacterium]MCM8790937.1 glycosyltransferase family 4 protein [Candidatus Omnitrophota bacterium]